MSVTERIVAQAKTLLRDLEEQDLPKLELLCRAAEVQLTAKLRPGLLVEDCIADFIAASALYAVAAMTELDETAQLEMITMGDMTLRRKSTDAAACCLRYQAELIISPFVADAFAFLGV
jgi:hypothetical protein